MWSLGYIDRNSKLKFQTSMGPQETDIKPKVFYQIKKALPLKNRYSNYLLLLIILLNIDCIFCREKEPNTEAKLVLSILKKENIKYCLYSTEIRQWANWTISDFKYLATNGVFTVFIKQKKFDHYLKSNVKKIRLGAAVMKTEDLAHWCDFESDRVLYRMILANIYFIVFDTPNKKLMDQVTNYDIILPYNSNLFLVTPDESENYDVTEIYKNIQEGNHNYNLYGRYDKNCGLIATTRTFYERRFDLNGSTLVAWGYEFQCDNRLLCTFVEIWEIFGTMMNFRSANYNERGPLKPEAVVIAPHASYFSDVHFVGPIYKTLYFIYVKDTFDEDQSIRTYSKPFSDQLWIYILVWATGLSIFHVFIRWIQRFYDEMETTQDTYSIVFSPFYYLMNTSDLNLSTTTYTRIVLLLTSLIAIIISYSYNATFFSFIMIKKPKYPFTDLESFIKDGTYKLAASQETFPYSYFEDSSDPKIKTINQKFLHDINDRVADPEDGAYRLCKDKKFAFTCQPAEMYNYRHYCKILNIPTEFFQCHTLMQLGNPSPFREIFNQNLMTVRSSGVLKKIVSSINTQFWKIDYETKTEVDFVTIAPVLLLTFYIYAISVFILIVEKVIFLVKAN